MAGEPGDTMEARDDVATEPMKAGSVLDTKDGLSENVLAMVSKGQMVVTADELADAFSSTRTRPSSSTKPPLSRGF